MFGAAALVGAVVAVGAGGWWVRSYGAADVLRVGTKAATWRFVSQNGFLNVTWIGWGNDGQSAKLELSDPRPWEWDVSGNSGLFQTPDDSEERRPEWQGIRFERLWVVHFATVAAMAGTPAAAWGVWRWRRAKARARALRGAVDAGERVTTRRGRRIGRVVGGIATAASAVVLVLVTLAWVDSARWFLQRVEWEAGETEDGYWRVMCTIVPPGKGSVVASAGWFENDSWGAREPGVRWIRDWASEYSREHWGYGSRRRPFVWPRVRVDREEDLETRMMGESAAEAAEGPVIGVLVEVPYWLIAAAAVVLPARAGVRWWRRRGRRGEGVCAGCGYDLRATPGRCPECGREVEGREE